jgi:hypothetical protein
MFLLKMYLPSMKGAKAPGSCILHRFRVHWNSVEAIMQKNITLSAEESLIRKARERARREQTSLNEAFRDWLQRYAVQDSAPEACDRLGYADAGQSFTRDELNGR